MLSDTHSLELLVFKIGLFYILIVYFLLWLPVSSIITGLHSVNMKSQSLSGLAGQYMLENLQWLVHCFVFTLKHSLQYIAL